MKNQPKHYRTDPDNRLDPYDPIDWDEEDAFPRMSNVASACECTGMMPRPPIDEAEDEAYRDLFSNELPRK